MVRFSMARLASIFLLVAMCAAEEEEEAKPQNLVLGVSMVGCLLLAMGMWYLVHGEDPDIRETGWTVISSTISIFVAVLIFTFTSRFFNTYVLDAITPDPEVPELPDGTILKDFLLDNSTAFWRAGSQHFEAKRYLNQAFVAFWYGVLFIACMYSCKIGFFHKVVDEENVKEMANVKAKAACSLLFAHCAGFAGMEGWGMVMTSKYRNYNGNLPGCWFLAAEAFMKWFMVLTMCKWARDIFLSKHRRNYWIDILKTFGRGSGQQETPEEEEDEQTELFKETVEDGENDIYGLFVSFLIVQCLRYYVTGVLPNEKGEDEEVWERDFGQCMWLFLLAYICLGMSVPIEIVWQQLMGFFKDRKSQTSVRKLVNHTGRRLKDIFINFCTMSFAWCFMYAVQMGIAISGMAQKDKATLQVLLPSVATLFCFLGIRVLDAVADANEADDSAAAATESALAADAVKDDLQEGLLGLSGGELVEEESEADKRQNLLAHRLRQLPRTLMKCNAFIIGFSWESAFDTGVEGISAEFPEHATLVMTLIGIICCATILPAWYWYIVPMVTADGHKLAVVMHNLHTKIKLGFGVDFDKSKNEEHRKHVTALLQQVLEACHETKGMTMADIQLVFDKEKTRRHDNPIENAAAGMNG